MSDALLNQQQIEALIPHRAPFLLLSRVVAEDRAAQTLVLGAKVKALLAGRTSVAAEDIKAVALPALRHRVLLNFEAEAEGRGADEIVSNILETVPSAAADFAGAR